MRLKKTSMLGIALAITLITGATTVFASSVVTSNNDTKDSTLIAECILQQKDADNDIKQSIDGGVNWKAYTPSVETEYFTYDEFSKFIENETKEIAELVSAGEWTQEKADEVISNYESILENIKNGVKVSKRQNYSDDIVISSMPDVQHTEGFSTTIYDGTNHVNFGPYEKEEDLLAALKEYCETEIQKGSMTQDEAKEILNKD